MSQKRRDWAKVGRDMAAMAGENDLECPLRPRDHFECDELGSKFLKWYYSINLNVKELVMQIFF